MKSYTNYFFYVFKSEDFFMKSVFLKSILINGLILSQIMVASDTKNEEESLFKGLQFKKIVPLALIGLAIACHELSQPDTSGHYVCPTKNITQCDDATIEQGPIYCRRVESNTRTCVPENHMILRHCTKPWMRVKDYDKKIKNDFKKRCKWQQKKCGKWNTCK